MDRRGDLHRGASCKRGSTGGAIILFPRIRIDSTGPTRPCWCSNRRLTAPQPQACQTPKSSWRRLDPQISDQPVGRWGHEGSSRRDRESRGC